MKNRSLSLAIITLAAVFVLAACSNSGTEAQPSPSSTVTLPTIKPTKASKVSYFNKSAAKVAQAAGCTSFEQAQNQERSQANLRYTWNDLGTCFAAVKKGQDPVYFTVYTFTSPEEQQAALGKIDSLGFSGAKGEGAYVTAQLQNAWAIPSIAQKLGFTARLGSKYSLSLPTKSAPPTTAGTSKTSK